MAKELDGFGINHFGIGPDDSVINQTDISR